MKRSKRFSEVLTADQIESFDIYDRALSLRLSEHRYNHSLSVSLTALELARIYEGIDPYEAAIAGLLHDWDKELPGDILISEASRLSLDITGDIELHIPLLHSMTAPHSLPEEFPELSEEVLSAVGRHTIGAVDMSPLDMIIYIADLLEPSRVHPRADALRKRIGKISLEELYVACMKSVLIHVVEHDRPVFPETLIIWNTLMEEHGASREFGYSRAVSDRQAN